jgi:DNA-binding NarL/FixJ family response regulator
MTDFSGRQIYLVGANRLQNELLAGYIEAETSASCSMATTLGSVPRSLEGDAKRLVLYDYSGRNATLENLIASDVNNLLQSDYVALINLSSGLDLECAALQCGVRGFLYYQGGTDILLKMIHSVLQAELWVSRELMTELLLAGGLKKKTGNEMHRAGLTDREIAILRCLSSGLTNAVIAETHCLSPHTVKTHIYRIFKKIKVANRLMAARWAAQHL